MDMVRYKTPAKKSDTKTVRLLRHKLKISETVPIIGKDVYRADAALSNVVGIAWHNQAR
jgi:hypothetical protein